MNNTATPQVKKDQKRLVFYPQTIMYLILLVLPY